MARIAFTMTLSRRPLFLGIPADACWPRPDGDRTEASPMDQSPRYLPAGHLAEISMVSPEFRGCSYADRPRTRWTQPPRLPRWRSRPPGVPEVQPAPPGGAAPRPFRASLWVSLACLFPSVVGDRGVLAGASGCDAPARPAASQAHRFTMPAWRHSVGGTASGICGPPIGTSAASRISLFGIPSSGRREPISWDSGCQSLNARMAESGRGLSSGAPSAASRACRGRPWSYCRNPRSTGRDPSRNADDTPG